MKITFHSTGLLRAQCAVFLKDRIVICDVSDSI